MQGRPKVIDTGPLAFRGHVVHLHGAESNDSPMCRRLARFLRRREVNFDMIYSLRSDQSRARKQPDRSPPGSAVRRQLAREAR